MTETEIRNKLRDAIGDSDYSPALRTRVRSRLDDRSTSGHNRLITLVAALLAIVIVASLVYVRSHSSSMFAPSSTSLPSGPPPPQEPPMVPLQQVPSADLAVGGLTAAVGVMSDPNLTSTSNGRTVRIIGAYADPARIVLIFRTLPEAQPVAVQIYDDRGLLNAGGGGGQGSLGDSVFVLYEGPHAGSDGMARLTVTVSALQQMPPSQGNLSRGPWNFAFRLKVQPATALAVQPSPTSVGSWKVTVETFELTPTVIHLKLLVSGGSADTVAAAVRLVDDKGNAFEPSTGSMAPAGSGQHLDYQWVRPTTSTTYRLQISGGGGHFTATVAIPAPPTPTTDPNVAPKLPGPYDLPTASESLTLQGVMSESVNFGHPWQCKAVNDPSGSALILEIYFRTQRGAWYLLGLVSDLADKPYNGPGTYGVRAYISPVATNGPADHAFAGTGTVTVTSAGAEFEGTVKATVGWDDDAQQQIGINGGWTCRGTA